MSLRVHAWETKIYDDTDAITYSTSYTNLSSETLVLLGSFGSGYLCDVIIVKCPSVWTQTGASVNHLENVLYDNVLGSYIYPGHQAHSFNGTLVVASMFLTYSIEFVESSMRTEHCIISNGGNEKTGVFFNGMRTL